MEEQRETMTETRRDWRMDEVRRRTVLGSGRGKEYIKRSERTTRTEEREERMDEQVRWRKNEGEGRGHAIRSGRRISGP